VAPGASAAAGRHLSTPGVTTDIRTWNALSGHPDLSWSIVAHVRMASPPESSVIQQRVARGWAATLGPRPSVVDAAEEAAAIRLREDFADRPYEDGHPLVRLARAPGSVVVAAHHSALDGLGLLALLGLVLDAPIRSGATGLGDSGSGPGPGFLRHAAARVGEAAFRPPARIRPERGGGAGGVGDHLLEAPAPAVAGGTAAVLTAAARAVDAWNGAGGRSAGRLVIAVGLSRRPGSAPTLADQSAYARVSLAGRDLAATRLALASARPEPAPPAGSRALAVAARLARPLAGRMGSTLLVSNLGRIEAPDDVRSISFWPVAHARSGVAMGVATVGDATVLGLRARRTSFDEAGATSLLEAIRRDLEDLLEERPGAAGA
jgi:hypothetical protein